MAACDQVSGVKSINQVMASKKVIHEASAQLIKAFNLPVMFPNNHGKASFRLPGFGYNDFDRGGHVNVYNLNRVLESGRPVSLKHFYAQDIDKTEEVMVMFAQHMSVSDAFYKRVGFDFPMEFIMQVIGKGRSSIIRQSTLVEQASGETMATIKHRIVNMNIKTRQSCDLSPTVVERYGGDIYPDPKEVFPTIHVKMPPPKHFSMDLEVQHSDMDILFHTNQAAYMKYSLDCAAKAAKEDCFTQIKDDICFYEAKVASTMHMWESFAGDKLQVYTWEDTDNPWLLHFSVSKGERIIYYSEIEFYKK